MFNQLDLGVKSFIAVFTSVWPDTKMTKFMTLQFTFMNVIHRLWTIVLQKERKKHARSEVLATSWTVKSLTDLEIKNL